MTENLHLIVPFVALALGMVFAFFDAGRGRKRRDSELHNKVSNLLDGYDKAIREAQEESRVKKNSPEPVSSGSQPTFSEAEVRESLKPAYVAPEEIMAEIEAMVKASMAFNASSSSASAIAAARAKAKARALALYEAMPESSKTELVDAIEAGVLKTSLKKARYRYHLPKKQEFSAIFRYEEFEEITGRKVDELSEEHYRIIKAPKIV